MDWSLKKKLGADPRHCTSRAPMISEQMQALRERTDRARLDHFERSEPGERRETKTAGDENARVASEEGGPLRRRILFQEIKKAIGHLINRMETRARTARNCPWETKRERIRQSKKGDCIKKL